MKINPVNRLKGEIKVPGDKSVSHRAVMLGSVAKGHTLIKDFLMGEDCLSTIRCFQQMGVSIGINQKTVSVKGNGLHGLKKPEQILDVGNSGTTMRLMSGLLCGQDFDCSITGDSSIIKRPMGRIIQPLTKMNGNIKSIHENNLAPLYIQPSQLINIDYVSPVSSAQVKSSIMLASLYTTGVTTIVEPFTSRNHSELLLNHFGGNIQVNGTKVICNPVEELFAQEVIVPSDISSAAYFMVAGLISKNSEIIIKDVGINPTRDGIIHVLQNMEGQIELDNIRYISGEKVADIIVRSSRLKGTIVEGSIIPSLIDEIPIIAIAAALAEGKTIIKDAAELKVKETNRIDTMVNELKKMGVDILGTDDGMIIEGGNPLQGAVVDSYHDHRVAMSLTIAALNAMSTTTLMNSRCIDISYPTFFEDIKSLF
ncbi:MAG: 3-phosphoshikimate 1-carboxyvinyltransferase [Firmicutes bacterium HGW-Firmicutes-1]|jgi:3-phosphoshikimate 1-carboxyvinyltransferase|nr:MAG: 3-phosphoshikimate 1-carboxyvinyltransferase [Firmicutes bacterium HGW-Firmicutes-1]